MEDKQLDGEQSQETNSALDSSHTEQAQTQDPSLSPSLSPESTQEPLENEQQDTLPGGAKEIGDTASTNGIEQLMREMQRLREDFETKVRYDESKERTIDALHKELQ